MAWDNHFLESIPPADVAALKPSLELIKLERDRLLAETGRPMG